MKVYLVSEGYDDPYETQYPQRVYKTREGAEHYISNSETMKFKKAFKEKFGMEYEDYAYTEHTSDINKWVYKHIPDTLMAYSIKEINVYDE